MPTCRVVELDQVEHLLHTPLGHAPCAAEEAEHLASGEVTAKGDGFGQVANVLLEALVGLADAAVDQETAGGRTDKAQEHPHQSGVSAAVWPGQHGRLSRF